MVAGSCGGGEGEEGVAGGLPAASGPLHLGVGDDGCVRVAVVSGVWVLAAVPVAAGGAEGAHGGGVAAAFGGEVAAVAEHVRPSAQGSEVFVRVLADVPGSPDEPALMAERAAVDAQVLRGHADAEGTNSLGRLGGVSSQVRRYRCVVDLPSGSDVDYARVDLAAPGDIPASRPGRVRDGREPGQASGVTDGIGELFAGDEPGERWDDTAGIGGVDPVEPEDGVEVDDAASLELGDFRVGEPDPDAAAAGETVEATPQRDDGAAPQLGRVAVPDDGRVIVVAIRTERFPEAAVVLSVAAGTGLRSAVRTGGVLAPGAASQDLAAGTRWPGVDWPE